MASQCIYHENQVSRINLSRVPNPFATREPGQPSVRGWGMTTMSYTGPDALLSLLRQVKIQVPIVAVKDPNEWGMYYHNTSRIQRGD